MTPPDITGAEVRGLAHEVFAAGCPPDSVRTLMLTADGYDRGVWRRWAREVDLAGICIPAEYGGSGLPSAMLGEVFEAAGTRLVCAPLLGTAGLAVPMILASGDAGAAARHLPAIARGEITATVAVFDAVPVSALAAPGGGWWLTGTKDYVVDGASADLLLVLAAAPDGPGVFAVERVGTPTSTVTATPLMSLDLTRRQATVRLRDTTAERIGPAGDSRWIDAALDTSRALIAAELVGVAQRCLDITVEYAKQRVQFGRPIGSFQAVKQRAAEMLIKVELARSAARYAVENPAGPAVAALAKAFCAETATAVAADAIQLHGGVGFTWEHDAHLYLKRAIADDELLGSAGSQWERVASHLDHLPA